MLKKFLVLILLSLSINSFAAHIVGGEVYLDSLGNDQYRVTFEIYRDCMGAGAAFDNPLNYTVFNNDGTIYSTFSMPLLSSNELPIVYDDPCVTPPNDICIELGVYEGVITLPATADGYYITYQRCCWAVNFNNISNPDDWGITVTTEIPGTNLVGVEDNNTARFNEFPPLVLCAGNTLEFDHSATDIDGDSLVYSLCDPLTVASNGIFTYDPEDAAPYNSIPWEIGFNSMQPFGATSNVTIDSNTGLLTITPSVLGNYVAAICVEEYRDGVLINSKNRTFGYRVVECDVIEAMQVEAISSGELVEGCSNAAFILSRDDSTEAITFQVHISGTATNGVDFNFLPDSMMLDVNVGTDTVFITPYFDSLIEGSESIELNVIIYDFCNDVYDTTTANLIILDYIPMTITSGDSLNLCDEFNENGTVWCQVQNGLPPYSYIWSPLPYANNDTLSFPATDLSPNLNLFNVGVTDACGQQIQSEDIIVYNQCPVTAPNVITANGDNVNDLFELKNLDDYDRIELYVYNRWGNLVFESENYLNDWDGKNQGGKELSEGVYYYVALPISEKFEYDDATKTKFTLHGFVHILK